MSTDPDGGPPSPTAEAFQRLAAIEERHRCGSAFRETQPRPSAQSAIDEAVKPRHVTILPPDATPEERRWHALADAIAAHNATRRCGDHDHFPVGYRTTLRALEDIYQLLDLPPLVGVDVPSNVVPFRRDSNGRQP